MTSKEWRTLPDDVKALIQPYLAQVPVKVASLARELGLDVKKATLAPQISGEIRPSPTAPSGFEIRVNRYETRERQRFTISHEIAHYLLHQHLIGDGIDDNVLYRSRLSNVTEAEANRLAADLLMPSEQVAELRSRIDPTSSELGIRELADAFSVSTGAMRVRLDAS